MTDFLGLVRRPTQFYIFGFDQVESEGLPVRYSADVRIRVLDFRLVKRVDCGACDQHGLVRDAEKQTQY